MYLPLCGGGRCGVSSKPPWGTPISKAAKARPEGLGCMRRCVGVDMWCLPVHPWGVPIPQTA